MSKDLHTDVQPPAPQASPTAEAPALAPSLWHAAARVSAPALQRRVLQRMQRRAAANDADQAHQVAAAGVAGPGDPLPHQAQIQAAFGAHDVSPIRAHQGPAASAAADALGAQAFATGHDVAFASPPDLHTAAHEAAHVIQQRAGVQLRGGVGQAGDPYEQHADAVADAVVQGRSAAALLDPFAESPSATPPGLQRLTRGSGWGSAWQLGLGLNSADQALWNRMQANCEKLLPQLIADCQHLLQQIPVAPPANITQALNQLSQDQAQTNALTVTYAQAAALDNQLAGWVQTAQQLKTQLTTTKDLHAALATADTTLRQHEKDIKSAPAEISSHSGVTSALLTANTRRDQLLGLFDPPQRELTKLQDRNIPQLAKTLDRVKTDYIDRRLATGRQRISDARADVRNSHLSPSAAQPLNTRINREERRTPKHESEYIYPALDSWDRRLGQVETHVSATISGKEGEALKAEQTKLDKQLTSEISYHQSHVAPLLPLMTPTTANRVTAVLTCYQDLLQRSQAATSLNEVFDVQDEVEKNDQESDAARAAARLRGLMALGANLVGPASLALGPAALQQALSALSEAELFAEGGQLLQYAAAHGAVLGPLIPHYQPGFLRLACRENINTPNELTVLSWLRAEAGTMNGQTVSLNDPRITRHGGQLFTVNFAHFVETHLSRYADAGVLKARGNLTTFYPNTVTTHGFITNQLQAGVNAWPDMNALITAINSGGNYNVRRALNIAGFTFELRISVNAGMPSLTQCFPTAPGGGSIELTAVQAQALGRVLTLHL